MKRPAVFFDRDNTLIACNDYLGDVSRVALVEGAAEAIARLRRLGYATAVFSNQSGVARGYFGEEAVHAVNRRLDELLSDADPKAVIDRHDFCPYHPDASIEKYRKDSPLRKPRPGMIHAAAEALALDLSRSWVIGDAPRDIEAGHAAGCRTILFTDPSLKSSPAAQVDRKIEPDYICSTLKEAVDFIEANTERAAEAEPEPAPESHEPGSQPDAPPSGEPPAVREEAPAHEEPPVAAEPPPAPASADPALSASRENMDLVADMSIDLPARAASRRQAAATTAAAADAQRPAATAPASGNLSTTKLESLALEILHELRRRHEQTEQDFSVSKLLGGIVQIIVLFVLFLAFLNRGDEKSLVPLLLFALTLQAMTIALLIMGKQK